jgi:hypothetical protein
MTIDQFQCLILFRRAGDLAHAAPNRKAVAVLHQGLADVAELRRLAVAFLV